MYELEASTSGGSSLSDRYVIQTPISSPERIPPPYNVSLHGPRSVFVAWSPPGNVYNLMHYAASLFSTHTRLIYPCSGLREWRHAGRDLRVALCVIYQGPKMVVVYMHQCGPDVDGSHQSINIQT